MLIILSAAESGIACDRTIDEAGKAGLGEAADAEKRSEVYRRKDAVVNVGLVKGGLAAVAGTVEHGLKSARRAPAAERCAVDRYFR